MLPCRANALQDHRSGGNVEIDVRTKVIGSETRILAVHAGVRRRYFSIFRDGNFVFLELPGFEGGPAVFDDTPVLRQHLRASEAIASFAVLDPSRSSRQPPERRPSSYPNDVGDAAFARFVGTVRSLYTASVGDLVLVPSYGGQYGDVLIGEIQAPFSVRDRVPVERYNNELVPYRRVKWLPVHVLRRNLSVALSRRLENRTAATEINRAQFGREVFSIAYNNYSDQTISKLELTGNKYEDPFDLVPVATLVRYFAAAYAAIEGGHETDIGKSSIPELIEKYYSKELLQNFAVTFSSPGKVKVVGVGAGLGLFILAGLGVAMHSTSLAEVKTAVLKNGSAPASDPVTQDAADKFDLFTNSIGGRQLFEIKSNGTNAKDKLDLKSDVIIDAGPP